MRRPLFALSFACFMTTTTLASAQEDPKRAQAEALFAEATDLMTKKDFATACPKLEEVVKLQPQGIGAKTSLADCYEGQGKLASAKAQLDAAAALADRANQADRAATIRTRSQSLDARVSTLTVNIAPEVANAAGFSVTRDGVMIETTQYNVSVPVDPGPHVIKATALGKKPFEQSLTIGDSGSRATVRIASMASAESDTAAIPPTVPGVGGSNRLGTADTSSPGMSPVRVGGIILGSVGVVALGVGIGVGVTGMNTANDANVIFAHNRKTGNKTGQLLAAQQHDSGSNQSIEGWVTTGIGGAAAVTGLVMIIAGSSSPKKASSTTSAQVIPWVDPHHGGMTVTGSF